MPFTPASCLSWCDWNVDKQADAEARGAFAGNQWARDEKGTGQVKANTYWIELGTLAAQAITQTCGLPATFRKYYFAKTNDQETQFDNQQTGFKADGLNTAIFPGGDEEKHFAQTNLACGKCYKISSNSAAVAAGTHTPALKDYYYVDFSAAAARVPADTAGQAAADLTSSKMRLFDATKCTGASYWETDLKALTAESTTRIDPATKKAITGGVASTICLGYGCSQVGANQAARNAANTVRNGCVQTPAGAGVGAVFSIRFSGTVHGGVSQPRSCPVIE